MNRLDVFKGTSRSSVKALVLIDDPANDAVRVLEKRAVLNRGKPTSAFETAEYVKPLSEIEAEVSRGEIEDTGKSAKSVSAAREVLRG